MLKKELLPRLGFLLLSAGEEGHHLCRSRCTRKLKMLFLHEDFL